MQRKHVLALLVSCAIGAGAGKLYVDYKDGPKAAVDLPAPQWPIAQAIDEAADYMARVCDDKGRFIYTMAVDGVNVKPSRYNVVRHAGAIYALADIQVQSGDPARRAAAKAAATRAADNLIRTYIRPLKDHPEMMAVWSDPKEEGGGDKPNAKLGGSGLGLIGLMGRERANDAGADLTVMRGLARFIGFMQKDNGDFVSKFTDEKGKATDFESLYYPGEAILGITMLYELDRDPAWLTIAAKGIARLVTSRKGVEPSKLPADHWLMIAIDRFLPFYGDLKDAPIPKAEIVQHHIDLGKLMMEGQTRTAAEKPQLAGCYTNDGRTTPSATRLEGLLALEHTLATLGEHADVRKEVRTSIVSGIQFLRRSQHTTGPVKGGFPQALVLPGDTDNGSRPRDDSEDDRPGDHRGEVRIDYAQHAVSALMRYRVMCAADATGCALP